VARRFNWIKHVLAHNWELKLLALLLAVLTYYAIRGATGHERDYVVAAVVEVEPGIAVLAQDPDSVKVWVRGSQDDLEKLDVERLRVLVRPKSGEPDGLPRTVPVSKRDIEGASRVAVVKLEPRELTVTFDREVEMIFDVAQPAAIGRPLIGKVEIDYEPKTVTVRGPKRLLDELKAQDRAEVSPEPVDVEARAGSFSKRVKVLPPVGPWVSSMEPDEITVEVNIIKASLSREWKDMKVLAIHDAAFASEVFFDPPAVAVKVDGRAEIVENLTEGDIRLFVDCTGLDSAARYELPVQVHLSVHHDIEASVDPKSVNVTFARDEEL